MNNKMVSGLKEGFICSKIVGKCTLEDAVVVPNDCVCDVQTNLSSSLNPGCVRDVRIIIDGDYYNCSLLYANPQDRRKPTLQFRYKSESEISKKLKSVFRYSNNKIISKNISSNGSVFNENSLSYDLDEKIEIFSSDKKDVFIFKCYPVPNKLAA